MLKIILLRVQEPSFYASLSVLIAAVGAGAKTGDWGAAAAVIGPALVGLLLPSGKTAVTKVQG